VDIDYQADEDHESPLRRHKSQHESAVHEVQRKESSLALPAFAKHNTLLSTPGVAVSQKSA